MKVILNTLYVQSPGSYLHLDHDTVRVELEGATRARVPLHHVGAVVVFGNVMVSPFLVQNLAAAGKSLVWMTRSGRFSGRLEGPTSGNVLLRCAHFEAARDPATALGLARRVVAGKLQNSRNVLLRAARETENEADRARLSGAALEHARAIAALRASPTLDELRGLEGNAARAYFGAFSSMLRFNRAHFAFSERSRHPPLDRLNALLSFLYAILANDCAGACEAVGLDPQVGFLHALRPGRSSLALDLMEEFRAPLADRLALTLINRNQLKPDDFVERPGGAINLTDDARKSVLAAYQNRKSESLTHPFTGHSLPFGLVPHVQARLLARHLRGDTPSYPPFILR